MKAEEKFRLWQSKVRDSELITDLASLSENEVAEHFACDLNFGTAGLRGIIGAGTNRMNIYTVRKATQGLANYLNSKYQNPAVAIAFDSRIKSELFAKESAAVLCANGINVFFNRELMPTPVLSFCVRSQKCQAGIMITASHNPAEYNGYKCYGPDGSQISGDVAGEIYQEIQKVEMFRDVKTSDFNSALKAEKLEYIKQEVYENYLDCVEQESLNHYCKETSLNVVYTPLNGAGNKVVREILKRIGVSKINVVKEQEGPDGHFPTCPSPNPESHEALTLALKLARETSADLVLATDPDCDRVGLAFREENDFRVLNGNEIGVLLLYYILSSKKAKKTLPAHPLIVKSIVSSKLAEKIAVDYGCELRNVLTGFKYIGEEILKLEQQGEVDRFIFGFEESFGYLKGNYVRDKDAVLASMLICEMVAHYKSQGMTLSSVLSAIHTKYGHHLELTLSFKFGSVDEIDELMRKLRSPELKILGGIPILNRTDFLQNNKLDLPSTDMMEFELYRGLRLFVRPSGTEAKIKVYVFTG